MEYPLVKLEVGVIDKTATGDGWVQEKLGAGCLRGNDLIVPGLVPRPETYIAWTTSAALQVIGGI